MELNHNTSVFFEPLTHVYLLGDKELIGVTALMEKHGLGADYSGISQEVLEKAAAAEGTSIHKEIEDYDNGLSILMSPLIQEYRSLGLKFVENEYMVSDNEIFASFIDGVYEGSAPGKVRLCDYKSTQKVHKRALAWQLGIYKVFFERQNPNLEVEDTFCLHIDKKERKINGLIPITPVTEEEVLALLDAERNGRIYVDTYQEPSVSLVLSDEEMVSYIANQSKIAELKETIKGLENILKEFDKRILSYMIENNLDTMDAGEGTIAIKKGYQRSAIDSTRLKSKRPDIYDQFIKTTEVAPSLIFKPNK